MYSPSFGSLCCGADRHVDKNLQMAEIDCRWGRGWKFIMGNIIVLSSIITFNHITYIVLQVEAYDFWLRISI